MQKISVSRKDLLSWAEKSGFFFNLDMSRISTVLLAQVCSLDSDKVFAGYEITDEIKYLEGKWPTTTTPAPDSFKYEPLKGLFKKHFTSARFIPKNIINSISGREGTRKFNRIFQETEHFRGSGYVDDKFVGYLAHHSTIEVYLQKIRDRSVTGEWIIFHRHNDLNYYLTLGSHDEDDSVIFKRAAMTCDFDSFPFRLKNV